MTTTTRETFAHLMIALAVCGGGYFLLVEPVRNELADVRSQVAEHERHQAELESLGQAVPAIKASLDRWTDRHDWFTGRSGFSADPAALYGRIHTLAAACGVRIDELTPTSNPSEHTLAAEQASALRDSTVHYSLTVTTTYAGLSEFLHKLRNDEGFVLIRSVRIAPIADATSPTVVALLETDHFVFDPAPPLAAAPAEAP